MKKVVIVDDESAGRKLIKQYLADFPSFIIVGEANNGVDAVKVINEFKPDLIFLDVQMPGMTGFEILPHLEEIPSIIFSTAYDQYALQAFEVHAVDYLLKPYTKDRFQAALQKVSQNTSTSAISPLAESIIMERQNYPDRILIESGNKLITIAVRDIMYIKAEGDYSRLISEKEDKYLSNYGISKLEEKLNPDTFIRIHRSHIVNINFIKSISKQISSYDVVMQNGEVLRVSRGYMDSIKKFMY